MRWLTAILILAGLLALVWQIVLPKVQGIIMETTQLQAWLPAVGELFFAECRRTNLIVRGEGDTATVTKQRDNSWCGHIFRLVACDDRVVVADIVYGFHIEERQMLLRAHFVLKPVGPDVAAALGLAP